MSKEKNKAEGVEKAADKYVTENYPNYYLPNSLSDLFTAGAQWQRNDPAFIAEIVEKALAYCNYSDKQIDVVCPDIVNQILKEKV